MAQRITRAKRKIKDAGIPFRIPMREDLPSRLTGVMAVLYLMYNEGYLSHSERAGGPRRPLRRGDPAQPDADRAGARATPRPAVCSRCCCSPRPRRDSRVDAAGAGALRGPGPDPLGPRPARRGSRPGRRPARLSAEHAPGQYQLLATIAATHAARLGRRRSVDWPAVLGLYDVLMATAPTPVVALNRAIALAHVEGPRRRSREVEQLDLERLPPVPHRPRPPAGAARPSRTRPGTPSRPR